MVYLLKMAMFNSYVTLPEGIPGIQYDQGMVQVFDGFAALDSSPNDESERARNAKKFDYLWGLCEDDHTFEYLWIR